MVAATCSGLRFNSLVRNSKSSFIKRSRAIPSVRPTRSHSQSLQRKKDQNGEVVRLQINGVVSMKLPLFPTRSQQREKRRNFCRAAKSSSRVCRISYGG